MPHQSSVNGHLQRNSYSLTPRDGGNITLGPEIGEVALYANSNKGHFEK